MQSLNNNYSSIKSQEMWLHLIISFFILVVLNKSGQLFKFAVSPYILYLVFNTKRNHIPALIILTSGTSIISYLVFLSIIFFTIYNHKRVSKSIIGKEYYLLLLISPVIIFHMIDTWLSARLQFAESFVSISYYLGIFPLFYGLLMSKKMQINDVTLFILPTILSFFLRFIGLDFEMESHRIITFLYIILLTIPILLIFEPRSFFKYPLGLGILSLLYLVIIVPQQGIKFHILLSVLISFIITYGKWKKSIQILRLINTRFLIFLSFIFMYYAIRSVYSHNDRIIQGVVDYSDFINYPTYIMDKIFGDRAVIWSGAWDSIVKFSSLLPPHEHINISYKSLNQKTFFDVEYGAHNIFLELILRLGWLCGIIVIIIITLTINRLIKTVKNSNNKQMIFYLAIAIGIIIGGGLTGQYILYGNFSFLLMSYCGFLIGISYKANDIDK